MIDNLAACILAACISARIDAFLIDAGFVEEAFRTDCAFGSTGGRTADIILETRTDRSFVHIATLAVWAAGRWHTWIRWCWRNCFDFNKRIRDISDAIDSKDEQKRHRETHTSWNFVASDGRIASVTGQTGAVWRMIGDEAISIRCTNAGTWIDAFLIHARLRLWAIAIHDAFGATFDVRIAMVFGQATA